jgi:hypothetical protein
MLSPLLEEVLGGAEGRRLVDVQRLVDVRGEAAAGPVRGVGVRARRRELPPDLAAVITSSL